LRADIGVMISASHNPYEDNGIKLFGPDGYKLSDDLEGADRGPARQGLSAQLAKSDDIGRAKRVDGDIYRYIEHAKRTLAARCDAAGLRIAIDCANGAAYKVAPLALWELGADVVTIGNEPNGTNINLNCGSTSPVALQKKVHEVRADIGIALDGDADRVIIVDENGAIIDGDQLMAVIAESWAESDQQLLGGGIVATVMSNLGLERFLGDKGLDAGTHQGRRPLRRRAYAPARLQCRRRTVRPYRLSDFGTTGDGLVAALQILAASSGGQTGQRGLPPFRAGAAGPARTSAFRAASRSKKVTSSETGDRRSARARKLNSPRTAIW
jgi:phosphoglucosamine mutase